MDALMMPPMELPTDTAKLPRQIVVRCDLYPKIYDDVRRKRDAARASVTFLFTPGRLYTADRAHETRSPSRLYLIRDDTGNARLILPNAPCPHLTVQWQPSARESWIQAIVGQFTVVEVR